MAKADASDSVLTILCQGSFRVRVRVGVRVRTSVELGLGSGLRTGQPPAPLIALHKGLCTVVSPLPDIATANQQRKAQNRLCAPQEVT